ncbi:MAG: hypothetical protein C0501_13915 [Isosphaera sp.]|nr:hypothetical protein [Isosphaera sp.]
MTLFAVLSPALAAGAAAAAVGVPLLIHLLFRKRYQVVPWAAVRFLLVAERRHRRRVDQWVLLALRALALLLPLVAMAAATDWAEKLWQAIKPGETQVVANVPRTHHVLVLDASLSMTARPGGGPSRFETAVAHAEAVVRAAGPGDGFTLLVLPGNVQNPAVRGPSNDPDKVVAELRKVKPTHAPADTAAALSAVAEVLSQSPRAYPRRQVTFLTDLQKSAWANALPRGDGPPPEAWQRVAGRADAVVVDAARADLDNLAVADLALADPLPFVHAPAAVTAVVVNHGRSERRDVRVQLLLGRPDRPAEPVAVEQQTVKVLAPGERAAVGFGADGQVRFRDPGTHVLQVRLVEPDDLPADDARALAVRVREGLTAVLVDGKPTDPAPARRAAWYLHRALRPPDARPSQTPARPGDRPLAPADFAAADLAGVDCVYLCDIPAPDADLAARLDAVLRRGGGVVIGLGPTAAAHRDAYNRHLFADGNGVLPGPLADVVTAGPNDPGFRLAAEEEEYRRPPLALFRDEDVRAGLVTVPFTSYLRLDVPPDGRARRLLSFVPAGAPGGSAARGKPDPAVVEWTKHRGRVVVYTSSFNEDWNIWPTLPTYLPFQDQLLKFVAATPDRHTVPVGDTLEEFYPPAGGDRTASLVGPEGLTADVPLALRDEAEVARFPDARLAGLYRFRLKGAADAVFAVNTPESATGAGPESDLRRIDPTLFRSVGPVQVVADPADIRASAASGAELVSAPKPHGPAVARVAVLLALAVLAAELFLAWRWGPARNAAGAVRGVDRKWIVRVLSTAAALVPLAAAVFVLGTLVHYERTGDLLGFLPDGTRRWAEAAAGVPAAQPGEGTRWRLEWFTTFSRNGTVDRRVVLGLAAAALVLTVAVYRLERRAVAGAGRVVVPGLTRLAVFLLALFVLLPQVRLAFDREGWPEVVILVDTSASMGHEDDYKDPAVRAKAEELVAAAGLPKADRLRLAQAVLTRPGADWLDRLLQEKQVKVHLFTVDMTTRHVGSADQSADAADVRAALRKLTPDGEASRLGEGVEAVLKAFKARSLAAVVMFTDGVTTAGDGLREAGREAARAGVPLFLVGVGDAWDVPDLELTDVQAEDTVTVGDRLVFDARLAARGQVPPDPVAVVLYERVNGELVERGRQTVTPDPGGNRVPVTVAHTPTEAGVKTFILAAPTVPGETDGSNNRVERTVVVTDSKRLQVLYIEGYPRYDFRFVKTLLEREAERSAGGKGVEVHVLLLGASAGWATTDRSARFLQGSGRGDFPTRDQLFAYDAVILGDVDPKQIPKAATALQDLADFVRVRKAGEGGGLLFLCGEHGTPAAYADTPLADILPVTPDPAAARAAPADDGPSAEPFRPRLTPAGEQHPLFRFSPDPEESKAVWKRLQPLYWAASGYRRKANTVVLAEHPDRPAEGAGAGERHPLVVQAFAGAGLVLFFGFDDTWRWRYRNDEEYFDRFWVQAVRVLSKARSRRVELRVEPKSDFRRDEKMTVVVRFPVEAPAPPPGQPVRVALARGPLPRPDGSPGVGPTESSTLSLARVEGPGVQYATTLTRTPEGEYRFTLVDPEPPPGTAAPTAVARVRPPLAERDRVQLNKPDLAAAAALSPGGFYTLADADRVLDDLKDLNRVPLNQPCDPVPLWNHPLTYLLLLALLASEWLLRKRERLL